MVNENAYHKEGFYFIFYCINKRPSCASNKWRIRSRWIKHVKFLSDNNETAYSAVAYFIASIKTNNYNKFDGIMQTNLTRDKVDIV